MNPGQDQSHGRSDHPTGAGFLTASNILSLSRIPLGVLFLAVDGQLGATLIVAAGALTDMLDGWLARVTRTTSEIGALLDPFCDRIFVLLGLISFLPAGHLDWAGMLVLILRDLFTGGVYLVQRLAGRHLLFQSRPIGKVTTAFQVLALFTLILRPELINLPIILVGVTSVMAIIDYGMAGLRADAVPQRT